MKPGLDVPSNDEVQLDAQALAFGRRTRAGSSKDPRAWLYSANARVGLGLSGSATGTAAGESSSTNRWAALEERVRHVEAFDGRLHRLLDQRPQEAIPQLR